MVGGMGWDGMVDGMGVVWYGRLFIFVVFGLFGLLCAEFLG